MTADFGGMSMRGLQTIGYDTKQGKYVGTWVDSSNDFMWRYVGTVDDAGKKLTLAADGPSFFDADKLSKFEDIYEFVAEDEMKMTSRMQTEDGSWVTFMEGTAKRTEPTP